MNKLIDDTQGDISTFPAPLTRTAYLRSLVRGPQGGGPLSRAQAFRATENLLKMLNRLLETYPEGAWEDEDSEGDVSSFEKPSMPPIEDIVNTFVDYTHSIGGRHPSDIARRVAMEYDIDIYDVANALAEDGDEDTAQEIIEGME